MCYNFRGNKTPSVHNSIVQLMILFNFKNMDTIERFEEENEKQAIFFYKINIISNV